MTRLEPAAYLDHIRAESARFREALAQCPPTTPVPSCPEWTADDLLRHLCNVQSWWTEVLVNRPGEAGEERPTWPAAYDDLLVAYDETLARFLAELASADPAEEAWTWSYRPADRNVGFTYRRQAHEALIHRLDAELAAGAVTPLDPALALDGVDECLDVMYGGAPPWGRFDPLPHVVEFRATDADESVWVRLGLFSGTPPQGEPRSDERDIRVVDRTPADAVVAGTADDLDAWLWHRRDDARITTTGDEGALAHLREVLRQPID